MYTQIVKVFRHLSNQEEKKRKTHAPPTSRSESGSLRLEQQGLEHDYRGKGRLSKVPEILRAVSQVLCRVRVRIPTRLRVRGAQILEPVEYNSVPISCPIQERLHGGSLIIQSSYGTRNTRNQQKKKEKSSFKPGAVLNSPKIEAFMGYQLMNYQVCSLLHTKLCEIHEERNTNSNRRAPNWPEPRTQPNPENCASQSNTKVGTTSRVSVCCVHPPDASVCKTLGECV